MTRLRVWALASSGLLASLAPMSAHADSGIVTLVSRSPQGDIGNHDSAGARVSADGHFLAFASYASNLVPNDLNGVADPYGGEDVFVQDLRNGGVLERVSVSSSEAEGNRGSCCASISNDGRYVAFMSGATNLIANGPSTGGIYLRDRTLGTTQLVSTSSAGVNSGAFAYNPDLSATGRFLAFQAQDGDLVEGDTNNTSDVFVKDLVTGLTRVVSRPTGGLTQSNAQSHGPSISADGRYVVFESEASNLVADDPDGRWNIFLADLTAGTTTLIDRGLSGAPGDKHSSSPKISGNGRFIAYSSSSTDLVAGDDYDIFDAFVYDRNEGTTSRLLGVDGAQPDGQMSVSSITSDGRFLGLWTGAENLAFGDGNYQFDAYRYDRATGQARRLSELPGGLEAGRGSIGGPSLSDDGTVGGFSSSSNGYTPGGSGNHDQMYVVGSPSPFDTTPPETRITSAPPALTMETQATYTFTASEVGSSFECRLDEAAFAACTSPHTVYADEGDHWFEVRATDLSDNTDETPAEHAWTIDLTAPTVHVVRPTPGTIYRGDEALTATPTSSAAIMGSQTVAVDAADAYGVARIVIQIDGLTLCVVPEAHARCEWHPTPGRHTVTIHALDVVGNRSPTTSIPVIATS